MSDQLVTPAIIASLTGREEIILRFAERLLSDPDLTKEERDGFGELLKVANYQKELCLCFCSGSPVDAFPHECASQTYYWALAMIVAGAEEKAMSLGKI